MNKLFIAIGIFVLVVVIGGFIWFQGGEEKMKPELKPEITLAPQVEAVLDKKIKLISELIQDQLIIDAVKESNEKNKNLSLNEKLQLDKRWRETEGIDDWINSFLTNEVALKLIEFQEDNPGFPEIFIADAHGLNVGQTNKTTDYYQADEDWWINSYAEGEGKACHGEIEFDESSQTEAIGIYVPVIDPEMDRAIGVVKAVLDITAIQAEL